MTNNKHSVSSNYIKVDNLNIHYLSAGEGNPVVLVHGWPTSSHLWRKIIAPLAKARRVLVPDLLGFGRSDKPLNAVYDHNYHAKILGDFISALSLKKTSLVVHDIGVPIGLLWAVRNVEKLERLVITDTLFYPDGCSRLFYTHKISLLRRFWDIITYPEGSFLIKFLLLMVHTPGLRRIVFGQFGVAQIMKTGVHNKEVMPKEIIAAYQVPFRIAEGGRLLTKTFLDLQRDELHEIIQKLPTIKVPVHLIYGENDSILPHLTSEMFQLKQELPDARLTAIPNCGHYLQEDQPERLSELLIEFLNE